MKSVLISNTGPIIALSGANHLTLLTRLYARILIPDEVDREIQSCRNTKLGLKNYVRADWIEVVITDNFKKEKQK